MYRYLHMSARPGSWLTWWLGVKAALETWALTNDWLNWLSWWFHPQVPNTNSFLSRQLSMFTTTQTESAFMPPLLCSCHCIHLECSPPRQTLLILCNSSEPLSFSVLCFWTSLKYLSLPLLSSRTISVYNLLAKNHLSSTKLNSSIVVLIYYLNQEEFPPFSCLYWYCHLFER